MRRQAHPNENNASYRVLLADMAAELVEARELAGEKLDRWLSQVSSHGARATADVDPDLAPT